MRKPKALLLSSLFALGLFGFQAAAKDFKTDSKTFLTEEVRAQATPTHNPAPKNLIATIKSEWTRRVIDPRLEKIANFAEAGHLSPAGAWIKEHFYFDRPIISREANLYGEIYLKYVLKAFDRSDVKFATPAGELRLVKSESLGRSAIYVDGKFKIFSSDLASDVPKIAFVEPVRGNVVSRSLKSERGWFNFFREDTKAAKWEGYKGVTKESFRKSTSFEIEQARLAALVPPGQAANLRAKGFLPINELAGGTPHRPSDVEGWVFPFRDGAPTFPSTD